MENNNNNENNNNVKSGSLNDINEIIEVNHSPILSKKRKNDVKENNKNDEKKSKINDLSNKEGLFIWGEGIAGQIGLGDEVTRSSTPTKLETLKDLIITNVACGAEHTLAYSGNFDLWTWGSDEYSQLGHNGGNFLPTSSPIPSRINESFNTSFDKGFDLNKNSTTSVPKLLQLSSLFPNNKKPMILAAGEQHSLILFDDNTVCTFGSNVYGQCGHGATNMNTTLNSSFFNTTLKNDNNNNNNKNEKNDKENESFKVNVIDISTPKLISSLDRKKIISASCGAFHSILLSNAGEVFTFGLGSFGQLGHGDKNNKSSPCVVNALWAHSVVFIAAGSYHSAVITITGEVFMFGKNDLGACANPLLSDLLEPSLVQYFDRKKIISIACGSNHTLFLTANGRVLSCGSGRQGQLGHAHTCDRLIKPTVISSFKISGHTIVKIACGEYHSCALSSNGELWTWGDNRRYQLGVGKQFKKCTTPKMITNTKFTSVFCGKSHTIALSYTTQIQTLNTLLNQQQQIFSSSISCNELNKIVKQSKLTNNYEYVISILKKVFSSPGSLNASFIQPNKGIIDLKSVFQLYDSFFQWGSPQLFSKFSDIILKLIHKTYTSLNKPSSTSSDTNTNNNNINATELPNFDIVSQFIIIISNPMLNEKEENNFRSSLILQKLAHTVYMLPQQIKEQLFTSLKTFALNPSFKQLFQLVPTIQSSISSLLQKINV